MLELLKVSVSKQVTVKTDFSHQLPVVRAIPAQIRQIVINLITNASEAIGDRDGVISVTTSQMTVGGDSPVATSERMAKGDYVQMEVSDAGRGMTPEVQARIFDPFFNGHPRSGACGSPSDRGTSPRDHPAFMRTRHGNHGSDIAAK
jgi:two-component system, cell cycle sensor histidine kinase and response regulator CckA